MAKIKKKGTSGAAKNFISRTRAVRKLQISLPDFRRLCIFKGIYPREPRKRSKVSKSATASTTYYYTRDIQYLLHEPLIQRFREHAAVSKKIGRALGKGDVGDAARLERQHPVGSLSSSFALDHIVRERYPTFADALRELDDCLSLLSLFANLPGQGTVVEPRTMERCQRLCHEFQHYLILTHSLRKSFLSIKGIYYQAEVRGEEVMWLVPYKFVQRVTSDVDLRIMSTFVEFYATLLAFVNFRLYTTVGLVYPPKFDAKSDEMSGELGAFKLEGRGVDGVGRVENGEAGGEADERAGADPEVQRRVDEISRTVQQEPEPEEPSRNQVREQEQEQEQQPGDEIDKFESTDPSADSLEQPSASPSVASTLFAPYTFFLSRETPRAPLEFILKSFGCNRLGWPELLGAGAYTHDEADPSITHQIVDRPPLPTPETSDDDDAAAGGDAPAAAKTPANTVPAGHRVAGRTYVQPQWVWDCINAGRLLRPDLYAPGASLPPHLSPWVQPKKGQYDPTQPLEAQAPEGEAEKFAEAEADAARLEAAAAAADGEVEEGGVEDDNDDKNDDDDEDSRGALEEDDSDGEEGRLDGEFEIPDEMFAPMEQDADKTDESEDGDEDGDADADGFAGFSDQDVARTEQDNEAIAAARHQAELEAESLGMSLPPKPLKGILKQTRALPTLVPPPSNNPVTKAMERKKRQEQEELDRRIGMMSRKRRKTYERMMFGNDQRDEKAERLRTKRRKLESEGKRKAVP